MHSYRVFPSGVSAAVVAIARALAAERGVTTATGSAGFGTITGISGALTTGGCVPDGTIDESGAAVGAGGGVCAHPNNSSVQTMLEILRAVATRVAAVDMVLRRVANAGSAVAFLTEIITATPYRYARCAGITINARYVARSV
jgi:hypothetical protein